MPEDATPAEKYWRKMFEEEPKKYRKRALEEGEQVQEKFRTSRGAAAAGKVKSGCRADNAENRARLLAWRKGLEGVAKKVAERSLKGRLEDAMTPP